MFLAFLSCTSLAQPTDLVQFKKFLADFRPEFTENESSSEFQRRFANFRENMKRVEELNREGNGAEFSLHSPFADMSESEFRTRILLRPRGPAALPVSEVALTSLQRAPSSWDWRDHGAVTDVKDQGALGTCWAFSTIQNLEGQAFLKKGRLVSLSVEQLVECDNSDDSANQRADCAAFGGWPYLAFQFLQKAGGVFLDSEWPYCAGWSNKSECFPCMPEGYSKKDCGDHSDMFCNATTTKGQAGLKLCRATSGFYASLSGWKAFGLNETEIAAALVETGPLSVALNAGTLNFYRKGIYNPAFCDPKELDHAVLLVGYGSENGQDYWTVKNSWGPKWGEQGYFRILRGTGKCGINTQVATGLVL